MTVDVSVKIGGEAGQGIQSVGSLLAEVCRESGFYIMAINDFESRIRGGHSFFQIRISDRPIQAPASRLDLLIGLNRETFDLHNRELNNKGLAIIEGETGRRDKKFMEIPFKNLAKQFGRAIYSNTVAAASCLCLLGAPLDIVQAVLSQQFKDKPSEVIENNLKAAEFGYEAVAGVDFSSRPLANPSPPKGMLMEGAKALALGAIASDCRVAAFYPMSPATSILSHMNAFSKELPLVVEQAEDEIAAVNMAIGASFAGVRAMTATSGGGFCLMTEGLGLAAISETPIVIIDAQRPGPATGLPTRTAQGDLNFVIHASQDDFPRFVLAPGTPEEAFSLTQKAFYLSDKYQVPAIVLVDQYLTDSLYTLEKPFSAPKSIERWIVEDKDMDSPKDYKRFALTHSGISPRAIPCAGNALVVVSSDEHTEEGHMTEESRHRNAMVNKRNAKLPSMTKEMSTPSLMYPGAKTLLVGWGSTAGAIKEAVLMLRDKKRDVGCMIFTDLWPFPIEKIKPLISGRTGSMWMVEQNSTAQLGQIILSQTGVAWTHTLLKYDGRPFYPQEIVDAVKNQEAN